MLSLSRCSGICMLTLMAAISTPVLGLAQIRDEPTDSGRARALRVTRVLPGLVLSAGLCRRVEELDAAFPCEPGAAQAEACWPQDGIHAAPVGAGDLLSFCRAGDPLWPALARDLPGEQPLLRFRALETWILRAGQLAEAWRSAAARPLGSPCDAGSSHILSIRGSVDRCVSARARFEPDDADRARLDSVGSAERGALAGTSALFGLMIEGLSSVVERRARQEVQAFVAEEVVRRFCPQGDPGTDREARATRGAAQRIGRHLSSTCALLREWAADPDATALQWSAVGEALRADLHALPASAAADVRERIQSGQLADVPGTRVLELGLILVDILGRSVDPQHAVREVLGALIERTDSQEFQIAAQILLALVDFASLDDVPANALLGVVQTVALAALDWRSPTADGVLHPGFAAQMSPAARDASESLEKKLARVLEAQALTGNAEALRAEVERWATGQPADINAARASATSLCSEAVDPGQPADIARERRCRYLAPSADEPTWLSMAWLVARHDSDPSLAEAAPLLSSDWYRAAEMAANDCDLRLRRSRLLTEAHRNLSEQLPALQAEITAAQARRSRLSADERAAQQAREALLAETTRRVAHLIAQEQSLFTGVGGADLDERRSRCAELRTAFGQARRALAESSADESPEALPEAWCGSASRGDRGTPLVHYSGRSGVIDLGSLPEHACEAARRGDLSRPLRRALQSMGVLGPEGLVEARDRLIALRGLVRQLRGTVAALRADDGEGGLSEQERRDMTRTLLDHLLTTFQEGLWLFGRDPDRALPRELHTLLNATIDGNYPAILTSVVALLAHYQGQVCPASNGSCLALPTSATQALAFGASLLEAESAEDVDAIIERFALPVGSWRAKLSARSEWHFFASLSAYVGFAGGREWYPMPADARGTSLHSETGGLHATFGLDLTLYAGTHYHLGLYFPILDLSNYVSAPIDLGLDEDSAGDQVDASYDLRSVVAPGVFARVGLGRSPFVFGLGASYVPRAREASLQMLDGSSDHRVLDAIRVSAFLAVDVTLFRLAGR